MINTLQLEMEMKRNNITKTKCADMLGISIQALALKLQNKNEFKASEIKSMIEFLNLDDAKTVSIFFANDVE